MSHTVTAQHSSVSVEGLRAATPYVVQVRARTVAGYGRYSIPKDFSTSTHSKSFHFSSSFATSLSHSFSLRSVSVSLSFPLSLLLLRLHYFVFPSLSLSLPFCPITIYHCPSPLILFTGVLKMFYVIFNQYNPSKQWKNSEQAISRSCAFFTGPSQ